MDSIISNKALFWTSLLDNVFKDSLDFTIKEDWATQIKITSHTLPDVVCNLFLYRGASLCEFVNAFNRHSKYEEIYTKSESKFVPIVQDLLHKFSFATDTSFLPAEDFIADPL